MAEEIYREWFVRFRFPGYEKVKFKKGVPGGWKVKRIGDIVGENMLQTGKRPKGGAQVSGIPIVGAENVIGLGKYDYSKEKYVNEQFFESMKQGRIQNKDILFYKDGADIGRVSLFQDGFPHEKCCVNEHIFLIRTHDLLFQYYLYFFLAQPAINEYVKAINKNAAQPGINKNEFRSISMVIPKYDILKRFNEMLIPILSTLFIIAKSQTNLKKCRDSMLPRLISGKLSVENRDIQFSPSMLEETEPEPQETAYG